MGVYLHKTGYHRAVADPATGEITMPAGNDYEKVVGELAELEAEYSSITLNRGKANEVTVLLDRMKGWGWETPFQRGDGTYAIVPESVMDATGLVPSFCSHGLELHPATGKPPHSQGRTWVRSRLLTIEPGVPPRVMCHCEHVPGECPGSQTCPKEIWG